MQTRENEPSHLDWQPPQNDPTPASRAQAESHAPEAGQAVSQSNVKLGIEPPRIDPFDRESAHISFRSGEEFKENTVDHNKQFHYTYQLSVQLSLVLGPLVASFF